MRILHLLDQASPEANPGTLRVLQVSCEAQAAHEHHVLLMGGTPMAEFARAACLRRGRVVGVPAGRAAEGALTLASHIEALEPIDVMHAWSPATAAAFCARFAKTPLVLTVCQPLEDEVRQLLERAYVMNPSLHLLVTHRAAAMELAQVHWPGESITLAPLPIWPAEIDCELPTRSELFERWGGRSASNRVGLLLCDQVPGASAADAVLGVAIAEHILQPQGISLKVLVHPEQTGRRRAELAASKLGQDHRVVPEPATVAPWLLTHGCDFALAVGRGGNVHSIAHAMAAGVPLIAERQPALAHLLEDEVTALLIPPDEPQAVGHALHRILTDTSLAERLSEAAQSRVKAQCMVSEYHRAAGEAYDLCMAGNRSVGSA